MDTRSGTIIDGRYEFGNTLGKGKGFKYFFLNSFLIYNIELGYITDWKFDVGLYEMTLINILGGLHLTNLLRYLNS